MTTTTERVGRTRIRVSTDPAGGRCVVRTGFTGSDSTAPGLRPMLLHHDAAGARISLVPDGALLLAGDAVAIDVTVDAGARLDLVEPGGTVAFAMRGGRAAWEVRISLGESAVLTWAGEPFVVSAGADVDRSTEISMADGAILALRETLVLGRSGEAPGRLRQHTEVRVAGRPVLVEDLPLDAGSAPALLGGNRVLASVLLAGALRDAPDATDPERYDLEAGGHLWRRLGQQAHRAALGNAWTQAVGVASGVRPR